MIRNQTYFHSLTRINSYNKEATTLKDLKKKLIAPVVAGSGGDGYCNVYISSDSSWTVTGDSTSVDLSGASGTDNWSSYAVEKPSELGGNSSSSSSSGSNSGSSSGTISGSASGSSDSGSSSDSASASSGSDSSSGSASASAGSDSSYGSASAGSGCSSDSTSGSSSSGCSSDSTSGSSSSGSSTDTSSSGNNSTDSSNSSDTNPTTGDNAPINIDASMGTIIIAAGAIYVVYNKKKRI